MRSQATFSVPPVGEASIQSLSRLLERGPVAVLTGAGCSTESGIPDYRGPETRRRARNPIKVQAFLRDPESRRRYWARAVVGFRRFADKRPNAAHHALARMERAGIVTGLITQNVDRLHHDAGSRNVVELHGALAEVKCLDCGTLEPREAVQRRLLELNPEWTSLRAEMAPDGDAELPAHAVRRFRVTDCERCGGVLKPNVVFFGESVPREQVERSYAMVEDAAVLLVVGSSLAVFSGYRFVKRATALGRPVGLVNLGDSRGDSHAAVRVDGMAGDVLPRLADDLVPRSGVPARSV